VSGGTLPLRGLRVVVTRPRDQADALVGELERRGATVLVYPAIRIEDAPDPGPLRRAAARAATYDWIVFTSANGVEKFWGAFVESGGRVEELAGVRFGCVGPATRRALAARGVEAHAMPSRYVGAAVAEAVIRAHRAATAGGEGARPLEGVRVLLPLAAGAADTLERDLREAGAEVERVEAYRSVPDFQNAAELRRLIDGGSADVVTFTSPSAVDAFVDAVGADLGGVEVAVIGPVTEEAALRRGLPVAIVAAEHTVEGLVDALAGRWNPEREEGAGVWEPGRRRRTE
jgi:uroporphyrinogen III methyltransferase/synthase